MSNVYLTSDLHLGHAKGPGTGILKYRPQFDTIADHDDLIATNWAATVTKHDTVWVLGDVALYDWCAGLDLLDRLPGRKLLVVGNHDAVFPAHVKAHKHFARYCQTFDWVTSFATINAGHHRKLAASHFPYDGDHTGADRCSAYRLADHGVPLLHGHTHSTDRFTYSALGTPQVQVGVDAWDFAPVALDLVVGVVDDAWGIAV